MTFTAAEQLCVIIWIKNDVALGINKTETLISQSLQT